MTQHLYHRPRRLRRTDALRRLVSEHTLSAADFIYPVFVVPGTNVRQAVASMPGVERLSLDLLFAKAEKCLELGVPVMALFPVIETEKKKRIRKGVLVNDHTVPTYQKRVDGIGAVVPA